MKTKDEKTKKYIRNSKNKEIHKEKFDFRNFSLWKPINNITKKTSAKKNENPKWNRVLNMQIMFFTNKFAYFIHNN